MWRRGIGHKLNDTLTPMVSEPNRQTFVNKAGGNAVLTVYAVKRVIKYKIVKTTAVELVCDPAAVFIYNRLLTNLQRSGRFPYGDFISASSPTNDSEAVYRAHIARQNQHLADSAAIQIWELHPDALEHQLSLPELSKIATKASLLEHLEAHPAICAIQPTDRSESEGIHRVPSTKSQLSEARQYVYDIMCWRFTMTRHCRS